MPRRKNIAQATLWSVDNGKDKSSSEERLPRFARNDKQTSKKQKKKVSPTSSHEPPATSEVFTVGGYLSHLGKLVGAEEVVVQGEISGFKNHQVGGFFSLKDTDGDGLLKCYMPPRYLSQVGFPLEDGMLVQTKGVASIYKPRGELSFTVHEISLVGDGSIRQAYEALKKKLEDEGLFLRKRELPEFIERIGFITAKSGEVIHDFQRNLKPLGFQVDLLDVRVQGNDAPPQIVRAIETLNKLKAVEIIIIARGGGSLEDLQAFNDERVARAIFKSDIPVLASIGHDRDVPIASLVADLYVSTPSIAAITMNRSWERLESSLPLLTSDLVYGFESALDAKKSAARTELNKLLFGMERLLRIPREFRSRLKLELFKLGREKDELRLRTRRGLTSVVQSFEIRVREILALLKSCSAYLQGVSPERNLHLGYSIVLGKSGHVIKRTDDIAIGENVMTMLADGSFISKVEKKQKKYDE